MSTSKQRRSAAHARLTGAKGVVKQGKKMFVAGSMPGQPSRDVQVESRTPKTVGYNKRTQEK